MIPSDHELGVLLYADICFCQMCILPFVVRIPIPPSPTIGNYIIFKVSYSYFLSSSWAGPRSAIGSAPDSRARGPRSDTRSGHIRGGIKKFWASGIFPIQIVQCFTPNVQKCVRYWLHLGSYCWLSLFSHNTWSKIHTPIELAKWTKLSTERW